MQSSGIIPNQVSQYAKRREIELAKYGKKNTNNTTFDGQQK